MRRLIFRAVPILLLAASLSLVLSRRGETVPYYAARTGLLCQTCHFDPNGGGPRNEFGFTFARNRHALEPEDSTSQWHDLSIGNRVGESMPLYFGVNQRFMLLTTKRTDQDSLERLGFFNMENAIHLVFQPHPRLTLVYSFDAFSQGPSNSVRGKEAFGMIGGFPSNGYLKAGRFRTPFGLRMDDHTVATRNAFLDFTTQQGFLPYDPRNPDMGIEIGAERNGIFGRAAFTNGNANVLGGQFAGAKTVKIGYNNPDYQGALSLYDDYSKEGSGVKRATRWGYYGMTHYQRAVLMGEIAAGTDEAEPPFGMATGPKNNLFAGFVEADYAPNRMLNFRVRYDHLELNRDKREVAGTLVPGLTYRDLNTHDRYALEGEIVPVPFAELRWTLRRINHKANKDDSGNPIPDENQAYVQLHFSY